MELHSCGNRVVGLYSCGNLRVVGLYSCGNVVVGLYSSKNIEPKLSEGRPDVLQVGM